MSDRSFIESWSLNFDDIAYVEGFNGSGLTCARCHRSSTRTSTPYDRFEVDLDRRIDFERKAA